MASPPLFSSSLKLDSETLRLLFPPLFLVPPHYDVLIHVYLSSSLLRDRRPTAASVKGCFPVLPPPSFISWLRVGVRSGFLDLSPLFPCQALPHSICGSRFCPPPFGSSLGRNVAGSSYLFYLLDTTFREPRHLLVFRGVRSSGSHPSSRFPGSLPCRSMWFGLRCLIYTPFPVPPSICSPWAVWRDEKARLCGKAVFLSPSSLSSFHNLLSW